MFRRSMTRVLGGVSAIALIAGSIPLSALAAGTLEWKEENGKKYWYEDGVKQGVYGQSNNVWYDGTERGREIYDPESDGWYWLDADAEGAKAEGKEVFMPYVYGNEGDLDSSQKKDLAYESNTAEENRESAKLGYQISNAMADGTGKWVRYDENGKMIKGWVTIEGALAEVYPDQVGNRYYYDQRTGVMAKGIVEIDGKHYDFDTITGVCQGETTEATDEEKAKAEEEEARKKAEEEAEKAEESSSGSSSVSLRWSVLSHVTKDAQGNVTRKSVYSYDKDTYDETGWEDYRENTKGELYKSAESSSEYYAAHKLKKEIYKYYVDETKSAPLYYTSVYEYDEEGRPQKSTYSYAQEASRKYDRVTTYAYDHKIADRYYETEEKVEYPNDAEQNYRETYAYDGSSVVKIEHYDAAGALAWTENDTYENGRIQQAERTDGNGKLYARSVYNYNGHSQIAERIDYKADKDADGNYGELKKGRRVVYSYNDKDNEIERLTYEYESGGTEYLYEKTATTYETVNDYEREKTTDTWHRGYTYAEDGQRRYEYSYGYEYTYYENGMAHVITRFTGSGEYDAENWETKTQNGRTEYADFSFKGAAAGTEFTVENYSVEYDKEGNKTESTDYTWYLHPYYRTAYSSASAHYVYYDYIY